VEVGRVGAASGEVEQRTFVQLPRAAVMHDWAVTERWLVLLDSPLNFSLGRALAGGRPIGFDRAGRSRFGVISRDAVGSSGGGACEVTWVEPPADTGTFHVFHFMNAWEERGAGGGERLVLLGCRLPSADLRTDGSGMLVGGSGDLGYLHEWVLDPARGVVVSERRLQGEPSDLPTVDGRRAGRRTRYGYAARYCPCAAAKTGGPVFDAVLKYDREAGTTARHVPGCGVYVGEPCFVPRPGGEEEDDGWVLVLTYDAMDHGSQLLVLSAQSLEEVAAVRMPHAVPFGFHCTWLPAG